MPARPGDYLPAIPSTSAAGMCTGLTLLSYLNVMIFSFVALFVLIRISCSVCFVSWEPIKL